MAIIVNNVGAGERLMYRVLLVDDEQIERMALAKKIDRYYGDKVNIYQAVNGREAVAMCSEQKNDIIIMDISMPEMNGVMAAKYIRQMDDKCSIVFLSAYDDFEYARNAIKVKALDYLLKPCDINDLLAVMDMAIQKLDKENADWFNVSDELRKEAIFLKKMHGLGKRMLKIQTYMQTIIISEITDTKE